VKESWLTFVSGAHFLQSLYPSGLKSNVIDLHEIRLHREGPTVNWVFDLPHYPDAPPRKWSLAGYNTVQVHLSGVGIIAVESSGWSVRNSGEFTLAVPFSHIQVSFHSESVSFTATVETIHVDRVSGYAQS